MLNDEIIFKAMLECNAGFIWRVDTVQTWRIRLKLKQFYPDLNIKTD